MKTKILPLLPGTNPGSDLETVRTTGGYYQVDSQLPMPDLMQLLAAAGLQLVLGGDQ